MTSTASPSDRQDAIASALEELGANLNTLQPLVDRHVTAERVARYLTAIAETPAPSTAATAMRTPVLRELLAEDGVLNDRQLTLQENFENTASTVLLSGAPSRSKSLWYFAHLDTISYLVQPYDGRRHPLVPFCYHLTETGTRAAQAYRYDLHTGRYILAGDGRLESESGAAFFSAEDASLRLAAGDRVVPIARCVPTVDGVWTGHFDNAGGAAALAVAAPIIAETGVEALFAFPDEEEGPHGSGSQVMGRGAARIVSRLASPDLAIVCDMQQAGGMGAELPGPQNTTRIGGGAVLSEFSSLARGSVTPPHLYALARHLCGLLPSVGVGIQESNNAYTSRSDDVSVLLKTPNILLLGFPGVDRHFDRAEPRAALADIVDLSKTLIYAALLRPTLAVLSASGVRP